MFQQSIEKNAYFITRAMIYDKICHMHVTKQKMETKLKQKQN